jgi:hypothetical protein
MTAFFLNANSFRVIKGRLHCPKKKRMRTGTTMNMRLSIANMKLWTYLKKPAHQLSEGSLASTLILRIELHSPTCSKGAHRG